LHFFPIGETKHSELLGYLLNPLRDHGQGDKFLLSFLTMLGVPEPAQGNWIVSVESGRVDLMLSRVAPASVIIFENKSHGAIDQKNQLYRYWYHQIYRRYPELDYSDNDTRKTFQVIYLPGSPGKTPDSQSIRRPEGLSSKLPDKMPLETQLMTFSETISGWIEQIAPEVPEENYRLRAYLEFYQELCRTL